MIDPQIAESARDQIADSARAQIESGGSVKHENVWGVRKMAYEIRHQSESDYRWYRFEAEPEVLEQLDHSLKIADGVMRFRIFKVDPDAPVLDAPPSTASVMSSREDEDGRRGPRGAQADSRAGEEPEQAAPSAAAEAAGPTG